MRSKTLRASDAERWCGAGARGESRHPIRCCLHLISARAFTDVTVSAQKKKRNSRYNNFVLCFTVRKVHCTGVHPLLFASTFVYSEYK